MEENDENFIKKKKLLMKINSGEINKQLFHYINEARNSPKDFSRHLMTDDDMDQKICDLSLFFKYSSNEVPPLIMEPNLEKCSQELIYHIISIDDGSSSLKFTPEEKQRNCLKERLKRYNLLPRYHIDLLIIGIDNSIEALSDILINKSHRKKLLSPEMRYIGIASGLLPSERLCIVIDIVSSFQIYDMFLDQKLNYSRPIKYNYKTYKHHQDEDELIYDKDEEDLYASKINSYKPFNNNEISYTSFHPFYNSETKECDKKRIFNSVGESPNYNIYKNNYYEGINKVKNYNNINKKKDKIIDLRISKQKCYSPSNEISYRSEFYFKQPNEFKLPVSVSIEKKYAKNNRGEIFPIYSKETKYDDGSILIQPYFDEYDDF